MKLWFRTLGKANEYQTIDLVNEFLDVWLQTRNSEDIDSGELAGVIEVMYDFEPSPGEWTLIEVRPDELRRYISTYIRPDGTTGVMMKKRDVALSKEYVRLLEKGYNPTPIIIGGAEDPETDEKGIVLIDGRHRIYAAVAAGKKTIEAYIPTCDLPLLEAATIAPESPRKPPGAPKKAAVRPKKKAPKRRP